MTEKNKLFFSTNLPTILPNRSWPEWRRFLPRAKPASLPEEGVYQQEVTDGEDDVVLVKSYKDEARKIEQSKRQEAEKRLQELNSKGPIAQLYWVLVSSGYGGRLYEGLYEGVKPLTNAFATEVLGDPFLIASTCSFGIAAYYKEDAILIRCFGMLAVASAVVSFFFRSCYLPRVAQQKGYVTPPSPNLTDAAAFIGETGKAACQVASVLWEAIIVESVKHHIEKSSVVER